jgi:hypothetical protein
LRISPPSEASPHQVEVLNQNNMLEPLTLSKGASAIISIIEQNSEFVKKWRTYIPSLQG